MSTRRIRGGKLRSFLESCPELSFNLDTRSDRIAALQHSYVTGSGRAGRGGGGAGQLEHYESLLQAARLTDGRRRLEKIERFTERGRQRREKSLLKIHQEIWLKEWNRLQTERLKVEREVKEWRERLERDDEDTFWRGFFSDAAVIERQLLRERQDFVKCSVQPLLRARAQKKKKEDEEEEVKREAEEEAKRMEKEFMKIWKEVEEVKRREERDEEIISRVIPVELYNEREGPNYEAALKELQLLDDNHSQCMTSLHSRYLATINNINGGWSHTDTERFCHVVEQYPSSLRKRWSLLINRLMREFPHLTRQEILNQEKWNSAMNHYNDQMSCLKISWQRNRTELIARLIEMLREEREALRMKNLSRDARAKTEREASAMWTRVRAWRKEKEEAARQEELEREKEREKEEEERTREERKIVQHRARLRAKVDKYRNDKWKEEEKERKEEERRKEDKEEEMKEERMRWSERVEHRHTLIRERQRREEEARERAMTAVKEREERLDKIRKTVEVRASHDPLRLLQSTKASEKKKFSTDTSTSSPQLPSQQPLFTVHGYRDNVVTSDPRFKVAAALSKVGLLGSKYAREVLAAIPPPRPTRPDQTSTILR